MPAVSVAPPLNGSIGRMRPSAVVVVCIGIGLWGPWRMGPADGAAGGGWFIRLAAPAVAEDGATRDGCPELVLVVRARLVSVVEGTRAARVGRFGG